MAPANSINGVLEQIYDAIVIGSGVGGGVVARRLSENGIRVLILERGSFVPRGPENWSVQAVFSERRYKARETWLDRRGQPFDPGIHYNVGGSTKFFGAAMFRLRERDFEELEHKDGLSPAWPYRYADLAPYYDEAEAMFGVRGDGTLDLTSPQGGRPYPYPAVPSELLVEALAARLRGLGLSPTPLPLAVNAGHGGGCILCGTCDGFPCQIGQKGDAEICAIEPALATGRADLLTRALARRLILSPDGRRVEAVEVEHAGEVKRFSAPLVVVSCGAINSAALLLRSADTPAPRGVANNSGVVGRHYMVHNATAVMALSHRRNPTVFQKTVVLNDYYFGDDAFPWPMGQMQMLGKLQGGIIVSKVPYLPRFVGDAVASRSLDLVGISEDLPDPENRVTLESGQIRLSVTPNNLEGHRKLIERMKQSLRRSGFPIIVSRSLMGGGTAHQCGTIRMGRDAATSALDPFCRTWDHPNLFVVDASFFPSSAAVNPALTIAAQALRAADHMLATDFQVTRTSREISGS